MRGMEVRDGHGVLEVIMDEQVIGSTVCPAYRVPRIDQGLSACVEAPIFNALSSLRSRK